MIKAEEYFSKNIINETNFFLFIMSITLIILSYYNFLLFHSLVEFIAVVVSFIIFMIAIYSYDKSKNNFLIILGIAYGFIGAFDLLHILSYKGMGVFTVNTADLPTQLWIIARYLESTSILAALWFINSKKVFDVHKIVNILIIFSIVILSLLFFDIFPSCYLEAEGLTPFKIISEYIISGILIYSVYLLYKKQDNFEKSIYNLIFGSIILTILSEISFTFYIDVYGFSNITGHIFKLFSVILIFKAIIVTGFKKPYNLLFRELRLQKEREEERKKFIESIYNNIEQGISVHEIIYDDNNLPLDYKIIDTNQAYEKILGISSEEAVDSLASDLYKAERAPYLNYYSKVVETEEPITSEEYYQPMDKFFKITATSSAENQFITLFNDISREKKREQELKNKYIEVEELSKKFESIIYLTNRLSFTAKYSIENFLTEILDISLELVKEADFGSISIFENEKWKVIDNRGYNKEIVNELNDKRDYIFKSKNNIFKNDLIKVNNDELDKYLDIENIPLEIEEDINKISKFIHESIFFDFDYEEDKKIRVSLDISVNNNSNFNESDKKLLSAFRNMIYVFIKEHKTENTNIGENVQLFED